MISPLHMGLIREDCSLFDIREFKGPTKYYYVCITSDNVFLIAYFCAHYG